MMQSLPLHYISALRVLATFLVILIHASTGYLNQFNANDFNWNYANTLNSFSRFSVPLFVMISGALLLDKKEKTSAFYRKRLSKICIPFFVWSIIYLIYHFYRYTHFNVLPFSQVIDISIDKLMHGASAHLWFLYMIVGLYLAIPFLRMIIHQASDKEILLFIALWAVALLVMNKEFNKFLPTIDLTMFSGYLGYLVLGYFLRKVVVSAPWWTYLILAITIGLLNTWGSLTVSIQANAYTPTFYNYLGINNAILAALVFLLLKEMITGPLPQWIQQIDKHSFGIYLVHIIILNYVHPLITLPVIWKIPVATLLTLILSFMFCFTVRKIPYGRFITG